MSIRLTCGRSQVQVLYRPPDQSPEAARLQGILFCSETCFSLIFSHNGLLSNKNGNPGSKGEKPAPAEVSTSVNQGLPVPRHLKSRCFLSETAAFCFSAVFVKPIPGLPDYRFPYWRSSAGGGRLPARQVPAVSPTSRADPHCRFTLKRSTSRVDTVVVKRPMEGIWWGTSPRLIRRSRCSTAMMPSSSLKA